MVLEITKNQGGLNWPTAMNLTAEQAQEQEQADEQARLRAGQLPDTLALSLDMLLEREGAARVGAASARPEPREIKVVFDHAAYIMQVHADVEIMLAAVLKLHQTGTMLPVPFYNWANRKIAELERPVNVIDLLWDNFVSPMYFKG